MTLNIAIQDLCKVKKIKKKVLAESLGISTSHMSQILHGSRPVRAEQIPTIAACLGVSTDELFGIGSGGGLSVYSRIVVETDEENPVTVACITPEEIEVMDGYRVRAKPTSIA